MDTMTLAIAGVAALAILLIAVGIAMSGSGSGINARLERYASSKPETPVATASGDSGFAAALQSSQALAQLNKVVEQRDFGANLARELARADLRLKPSEYLAIWAGTTIGVPLLMLVFSIVFPTLGNPIVLVVGLLIGFMLPRFWLGRRKSGRLNAFNKQLPDTITLIANALRAGSSFLQAHRARRARVAAADLHRVRPGHPRGQPGPLVRHGAREHGPAREVGRPRADGHGHLDPAHRRRQPRRDPRLDRVHHPRAGPHPGRDPHPHGAAAPVGLRRRASCRSASPASCSSPRRGSCSPMFDSRVAVAGLPAGILILALGGFSMFMGFMFIRRIVDIEV